jgi:hypothetical protein
MATKGTRRVTFTRTVTQTFTCDFPGKAGVADATILADTNTPLNLGELLAKATLSHNGSVNNGAWAVSGTSADIYNYGARTPNAPLALGDRVAALDASVAGANGKIYVVTVITPGTNEGKTAAATNEPVWNQTLAGNTVDGGITFTTIPKFYTPSTFAINTVYALGDVVKPTAGSTEEYIVSVAGTSAGDAPAWPTTVGSTVVSNTATFKRIA